MRALVDDYVDMLVMELKGEGFNKSAHRVRLLGALDSRSAASVERKHQNVSAILREMGVPFVDGYKPLGNYQELPAKVVEEKLGQSRSLYGLVDSVTSSFPTVQDALSWAEPNREVSPPPSTGDDWSGLGRTIGAATRSVDYAARDASNRELGRLGEQFVVETERRRLRGAGLNPLASKVEWTSQAKGDGFGYDVKSFTLLGEPIFIEVKTTNLGKRFPFIATRNEVEVSQELDQDYRLVRVFNFAKDARYFVLPGALTESCRL